MLSLSKQDARRVAVRAQLLAAPRPTDLLDVVRHLGSLQVDLTSVIAPSAELVLWSRLGSAYALGDLEELRARQQVVEHLGFLRPAEDIALHRAAMQAWGTQDGEVQDWVDDNDGCRRDLLERLRLDGPLPARALPDTCVRPWRSSGWTNDKNVLRMLGFLEARGEVAVVAREQRERVWDLAERVYPDDLPVPLEEAVEELSRRRLRALGIARGRTTAVAGERNDAGVAGEPATVEGTTGRWRVDPGLLDVPFEGRTSLLSPLDRLVFDRARMTQLFDFDYQLEMYKPAAKRKWGYWALPVLHGDRLIGKVDATADREARVLVVDAVHEDDLWPRGTRSAVEQELQDLAAWLRLTLVRGG